MSSATVRRETMPRAKKDGVHLNCYINRELREKLDAYAEEKGQTITTALERILKQYFDSLDKEQDNVRK